jgi:predicted nucleic acid-binding Zn ribbon protein
MTMTEPTPTYRQCRVCGTGVPHSGRPGRPSTYCSEDCRKQREREVERARRGPGKNRDDGLCPKCGRQPRAVTPSGRVRGWCRGCEAGYKSMRRAADPEWRARANASVRAYRQRINGSS